MLNGPMTLLTTVGDAFHGQVLMARLGAEGIVTEMKGAVGTTYPVRGEVELWVEAGNWDTAREIIRDDDPATVRHGDVFAEDWPTGLADWHTGPADGGHGRRRTPALLLIAVLALLLLSASLRYFVTI
ncbi:MAG: hypothetical protein M0Z87_04690 [Actinomycetota bacterium]|nr:hypothetical protein [Actinomycetota bacterium]